MRNKMRDHLLPAELESGEKPIFHLKHGTGGIVDIEFMVQYAVLAWSQQYPELSAYTDNVRILDALNSEGLWEESEVLALAESYKDFRSETHRLSLQQLPVQLPLAQFERQRQVVIKKWQNLMGEQSAQ
jgi:glutamate-ammonia-ligase adenylyltransferase